MLSLLFPGFLHERLSLRKCLASAMLCTTRNGNLAGFQRRNMRLRRVDADHFA